MLNDIQDVERVLMWAFYIVVIDEKKCVTCLGKKQACRSNCKKRIVLISLFSYVAGYDSL